MSTPGLTNMAGGGLETVRAGQPIRARHHNAVTEAVRALLNLRAGPGVIISATPAGWTIALDPARGGGAAPGGAITAGEYLARIVNVRRTDGAPETDPGKPSAISYDVTLFGRYASASSSGSVDAQGVGVIEDLAPTLGRPHLPEDGDHVLIHPAFVGQACKYVVTPVGDAEGTLIGELWVLSERVAYGVCETPGG